MKMTFTVAQLSSDRIGAELPEKTAPLGVVLFREMGCFFGVLPPLDVLNHTLRAGEIVNVQNILFRWKPFELSAREYEELKRQVLGHQEWKTDVDETFSGAIQDWSHWALVRSMNKRRQGRTSRLHRTPR